MRTAPLTEKENLQWEQHLEKGKDLHLLKLMDCPMFVPNLTRLFKSYCKYNKSSEDIHYTFKKKSYRHPQNIEGYSNEGHLRRSI